MQDMMSLLMLICASLAALAFGVLAAYMLCRMAFGTLRIHARSVATQTAALKAKTAAA
jgi:ABC-type glycerol-3-phosphate transport system permease component